uniref:Uncharacterized protein n=1 Tax=Eutreptiella gymnastica TaxID=73025 RepID=A0A7S1J7X9_9EUGL|mmetsp:Transcript_74767/g.132068  ORF Transcript_74767/g.132068 Transcript_74767/m.132068 type:complete len:129 (+) Transcript_74767:349-735(+)
MVTANVAHEAGLLASLFAGSLQGCKDAAVVWLCSPVAEGEQNPGWHHWASAPKTFLCLPVPHSAFGWMCVPLARRYRLTTAVRSSPGSVPCICLASTSGSLERSGVSAPCADCSASFKSTYQGAQTSM